MMNFLVDGVDLHDAAGRWDLLATSTPIGPLTTRSINIEIPGMAGAVPSPGQPPAAPSMTLKFKVMGSDDSDAMRNFQALVALLSNASTITRRAGGYDNSTAMELQAISDPTYLAASSVILATALVKLPLVYWRGPSADWEQADLTSAALVEVTTLAGSTGPVSDALLLVTGPAAAPKITDSAGGWVQLNLTLAAGERALIDCDAWTVRRGAGVTFEGGGTVTSGSLVTSGGPYVLRLVPSMRATDPVDTQVQVSLTASGMTSATALAVRARPSYVG